MSVVKIKKFAPFLSPIFSQAKRIQVALLSSDVVNRLQQKHSNLKMHLDGATIAASKASASMQASGQQALVRSAALQRKLDEARGSLSATRYESTLEETMHKMNAAVEQCLTGLQRKVSAKKRKVAAKKAAGGNTAKRARKVTFSAK